ncbi:MAG: SH3 domain-containing protein [Chloroflexi bacterium]|nr:MAG: SH3 domain-containing protein [Chloroflexota bacterium]
MLIVAIGLAACGPSAEELAATSAAETEAAAPTETPEPTATDTPEPTATEVPTETPEPTATLTPEPVAVVGDEDVPLREGPGTVYTQAGTAAAGEELEVLGQAYDCEWVEVRILGVGEAWVSTEDAELNVPCEGLEEATIPPTPAVAVGAPPASSGDTGDSSGGGDTCGNNPVAIPVNNKTGENATISLSGDCTYYFTVPPGTSQIFVVAGRYTYTFNYCGQTYSGVHAINSNWRLTFKC